MTWPQVAERYLELFQEIRDERTRAPRSAETAFRREQRPRELPPIRLGHLRRMTDDAGLLQHAIFTIPRYDDGYCLDDNARALLCHDLSEEPGISSTEKTAELATRYLAFVSYAFNRAGRALPQLPLVRPRLARRGRLRGQPRARALGARHRRRPLARRGTASASPVRSSSARCRRFWALSTARLGVRAARHRRVSQAARRRSWRAAGAQGARQPSAGAVRGGALDRLALVRG